MTSDYTHHQEDCFAELDLFLFRVKRYGEEQINTNLILGSKNAIKAYLAHQRDENVDNCEYFIAMDVTDTGSIGWLRMNGFGHDKL